MARRSSNESTSDLYIRLGLSLDELESGFVDAERTIRDNMARLSRSNRIIELQMQVDLSGLDEVADAEQIMQIRTEALNRQIAGQKDRVRLANAELRNMAERHGENSDQAQRARLQLEHERVALARLEEQLRHLGDAQDDADESTRGFADGFQRIADQCWNFIGIAQVVGDAVASLVQHFHELQQQAYELNMPFQKTKELLREIKLGGGDIGDIEGFIRGITDAYTKGEWDDPEFIALSKYGANITDATGRLKDFKGILDEVYQAYQKAKAAGEGIEFLQLVGGESGVRDIIQFFERYAEAQGDAATVFDSVLNPKELHDADRSLTLLTEQMGEFKDAVVSVATPTATKAMKDLFEAFRTGTEYVVKFKEELKIALDFIYEYGIKGFSVINSFSSFGDSVTNIIEKLRELHFRSNGIDPNNVDMSLRYAWGKYSEDVKEATESVKKFDETVNQDRNPLNQYAIMRIKGFQDELEELRVELDFAGNEYQQAIAKLDLWKKNELRDKNYVSDDERLAIKALYSAKLDQIEQDRADKLNEIREQVAQGDRTALENKLAALEKEKDAWLSAGMSETEAVELFEKRKAQIIEENWQKTQELIQSTADIAYNLTHDALEKQLYDVERWKDAQLQKAETAEEVAALIANAAMKEAEAIEREIDRIKDRTESVQDKLARLTLSQREYDRRAAKQEYEKNIAEGVDPALSKALFNAQMRKINLRTVDDKSGDYARSRMPPTREEYRLMNADSSSLAYGETLQSIKQSSMQTSQSVQQAVEVVKQIHANEAKTAEIPAEAKKSGFEVAYGDHPQAMTFAQEVKTLGVRIESSADKIRESTEQISELTQGTNDAPQNNIALTININLAGAYVADAETESRIADDVATKTYNAVQEAFEKATKQSDYGYAR